MIDLMYIHDITIILLLLIIIYLLRVCYYFTVWAIKNENTLSIISHNILEIKNTIKDKNNT